MNAQIKKLAAIADKDTRLILGLMSGTSMDGLDIALCRCNGSGAKTTIDVLEFTTVPFGDHFKQDIKDIFSRRDADLQKVCLMNDKIGLVHAEIILSVLAEWAIPPAQIDLIASHGQTIFHAPKSFHHLQNYPNATLQIGDGDHIAVKTGIITISDFRQKHLAAGGEGAPLAVYGDYLIFSKPGENRVMLNIGGISNFTYLPSDGDASRVFSTDVGPGNTLIDQFVQKYYPPLQYDKDAALAERGTANEKLLSALLEHRFFELPFPKTTGPELFNLQFLEAALRTTGTEKLPQEDVLATLCHFTARGISEAVEKTCGENDAPHIYLSGGGMHNPLIVKILHDRLSFARFSDTLELGIHPDAKEAVLFAVLANETVAGKPVNIADRVGIPPICMGKISLPE